ncbi:MAG: UDP-N-acetylmuramate dehydrogenase [Clostridia bacterium]|nr:UDP-N-acetylmuramate dehydrogenase [Clostridia bacterium]
MGFLQELYIANDKVYENLPIKPFTSVFVGGKADYLVFPKSVKEVRDTVEICKNYKKDFFVLGGGSNLLVSDNGFRGVIVGTKNLDTFIIDKNKVLVGSGVKVSYLITKLKERGISSLEFLSGVPLTVGGAVVSNAGAFSKSTFDFVKNITILRKGKLITLKKEDCNFSYRKNGFIKKDDIITLVEFEFFYKDKREIEKDIEKSLNFRKNFQPKHKTFGSTFINQDYFAGEVIEKAGLKGVSIGGARVSTVHANFLENYNNATAFDLYSLLLKVEKVVEERFNIKLIREVKLVGDFDDFNG